MPKAVVFDLGNVLLNFDYRRAACGLAPHCGVGEEELHTLLNQSSLLHQYECGSLTNEQFFEAVQEGARFNKTFAEFEPVFADIFEPIDAMLDLHERLREASIPCYIFSNTNDMAIRHIRETYPFFTNFTDYILSYQHSSLKPQPQIYEVVERITALRGPDLLYIDDRLENVVAGQERGWDVIHHSSPEKTIPVVESHFPSLRHPA